jgi:DNA-binding transcriptional ArsR family regulator
MSAPAKAGTTEEPEPTRGFLLDPAPHEVGAHLIFTECGLRPYHALDAVVKSEGGSKRTTFTVSGEEWAIEVEGKDASSPETAESCPMCSTFLGSLSYHESGLAPPEDPSVNFEQDVVREFDLHVRAMEDSVGERKANYQFSPRWPEMKTVGGEEVQTPEITGLNVKTQGSNIAIEAYPLLLRRAVDALDVNPDYFEEVHRYSNIFAFERYVRIARSKSGAVFGTNSPMERAFEYIGGHAKFRELREDDRNGVMGYHHRMRYDSAAAGMLIPGHGYGKRVKHYHPEHPRTDPSDVLYHPKFGVSLQKGLNTEGAVAWSDREDLREELDETLLNMLSWSGLPTRPNGETFVEDAYFSASDSARSLTLIEDPTEEMKEEQFAAARRALVGDPDDPEDEGMNATERKAVRVLADGGKQDVSALAEAIGKSRSTVYRVLEALSGLVRNNNGTVGFGSDYLAEQFAGLLSGASETIQKDGETGGSSAWSAFMARYGPAVSELPGDTIELKFGAVDGETDMKAVIRKGLSAWLRSGREKRRFVYGEAHWIQDGEACQAGGSYGPMDLPLGSSPRVRALD